MEFIGKLWNKLQSFPEFSALIGDVDNMQRYENKKIASLQTAFGANLSEFAKSQNPEYKEILLDIQHAANSEVATLRKLSANTSSFTLDLKQISGLHDRIARSRRELDAAMKSYNDHTKELKTLMSSLDQRKQQNTTITERAEIQRKYDKCATSMQDEINAYNSKKTEVDQLEVEYRKTIMQIIIAAYESYSEANYRAFKEIEVASKHIGEKAEEFVAQESDEVAQLELKLKAFEKEELEMSNEEDPKPRV